MDIAPIRQITQNLCRGGRAGELPRFSRSDPVLVGRQVVEDVECALRDFRHLGMDLEHEVFHGLAKPGKHSVLKSFGVDLDESRCAELLDESVEGADFDRFLSVPGCGVRCTLSPDWIEGRELVVAAGGNKCGLAPLIADAYGHHRGSRTALTQAFHQRRLRLDGYDPCASFEHGFRVVASVRADVECKVAKAQVLCIEALRALTATNVRAGHDTEGPQTVGNTTHTLNVAPRARVSTMAITTVRRMTLHA